MLRGAGATETSLPHRQLALLGERRGRAAQREEFARSRRASRARPATAWSWARVHDGLDGGDVGMTLPGNAAIPAADSRRMALAEMSGADHGDGARGPQPSKSSPRGLSTTPSAPAWRSAAPPTRSSPARPRGPRGGGPGAGALRRALAHHADAAQRAPVRQVLMEDSSTRAAPAVLKELLPLLHGRRAHRDRPVARGKHEAAVNHNPDVIAPSRCPSERGRHRDFDRQTSARTGRC